MLQRQPWLPFVLPFAVYLLAGRLEPQLANATPATGFTYPLAYTLRIAVTLIAIVLVLPVYRGVPWRIGPSAILVGAAGGVLWIVVCRGSLDDRLWQALGVADWFAPAARPAFNPLEALDGKLATAAFLAVRFCGLVAIVPLVEEFFVRGFLMRFVSKSEWWTIPLGTVTLGSAATVTVYGVLSHPAEPIAAALWFTLVTLLYARTRNLWDCVVAHAVTNGLLGLYVVLWQDWTLW